MSKKLNKAILKINNLKKLNYCENSWKENILIPIRHKYVDIDDVLTILEKINKPWCIIFFKRLKINFFQKTHYKKSG